MPNFGQQTWPTIFLPKLAAYLVDTVKSGLTRDRVFTSGHSDEELANFPPGGCDFFIAMFMPRLPVDVKAVSGAGNYNTAFDSQLVTRVFNRFEGDIENRSTQKIEQEAFGILEKVRLVLAALQTWNGPQSSTDGLYLFRRPMRTTGITVIDVTSQNKARWQVSSLSWEVSFVASLGVGANLFG